MDKQQLQPQDDYQYLEADLARIVDGSQSALPGYTSYISLVEDSAGAEAAVYAAAASH